MILVSGVGICIDVVPVSLTTVSALARLVPRIRLVDNVDAALSADDAAALVPLSERLQ